MLECLDVPRLGWLIVCACTIDRRKLPGRKYCTSDSRRNMVWRDDLVDIWWNPWNFKIIHYWILDVRYWCTLVSDLNFLWMLNFVLFCFVFFCFVWPPWRLALWGMIFSDNVFFSFRDYDYYIFRDLVILMKVSHELKVYDLWLPNDGVWIVGGIM